jgi:Ca2+/Na+ antiporter
MTTGFSVFLGVCSLLFPELLPVMAEDGKFSFGAEIMNIVGGIGFIIAWLHFCRKDDEVSRKERMLLANHCLLFGMAALLFHFSILWDATWWLWHMLHLFAYLVILWFFLNLYNQEEKRIIPCGLIMNELITNSFKHAFKDTQSGLLTIRFLRNEDTYTRSVSDNGAGLPDNYDWESPATLGLSLVRTLSAQLDAEINFKNDNGLTCNLLFTTT